MHSDVDLYATAVIDLFDHQLVSSPLSIQADLGEQLIQATLHADGSVTLNNAPAATTHTSIDDAMQAIQRDSESTSDAWQFWTWFSDERQAWTPLEHLRAKLESSKRQPELRTSQTHPLRIDYVPYPHSDGRIGLTFCPGKCGEGIYGSAWSRDLKADLAVIESWGTGMLISLMESHEFSLLGVPQFAETLEQSPLNWFHLPIRDMQIPDEDFETAWCTVGPSIHNSLSMGESIVIHCRGGLGRTGLFAARILTEAGIEPVEAVAKVRTARKHSIETYAQEHYVLSKAWQ